MQTNRRLQNCWKSFRRIHDILSTKCWNILQGNKTNASTACLCLTKLGSDIWFVHRNTPVRSRSCFTAIHDISMSIANLEEMPEQNQYLTKASGSSAKQHSARLSFACWLRTIQIWRFATGLYSSWFEMHQVDRRCFCTTKPVHVQCYSCKIFKALHLFLWNTCTCKCELN